ncbi:L-rhamnono-gamma-lactonase [Conoideocrella luteorostrata]|uniref:L-rhamnono-gamma-lactonase n=1 Tax=Conoideocrella luteorostrata TaxID=1105319 RepID=A0AAJ0FQX2_9HYPO|nr:L-rhamnono-gamma-lactonase [Conoideocrella luteorostrata]
MSDEQLILPVIDSHIHLYPGSEIDSLAWCRPDSPLASQRSVAEYKEAAKTCPSLLGFIFVETDRKHDLEAGARDGSGWEAPLQEVNFLKRIALGQPKNDGEGHVADDAKLCLAIIPWAPLPSGRAVMETYLDKVKGEAGEAWGKVKGFRYLLQDKPHGTMLTEGFIESLKLLGERGLVFEVGVDQHRRGKKQLDEVVEMIDRAHEGVEQDKKVTFVLNLTIYNITSDPSFHAWRTAMYTLSKASNTYMKLSGGFSEMPDSLREQPVSHIFQSTLGWLGIVLATFGHDRLMFGSDWPVCTLGGLGDDAWPKWREVVEKMCWMASLGDEERAMIFGGTAKKAYNL